jgi:hypothetical protein
VVVTSVLQTTAGKMIFGRYIDPNIAQQSSQGATANDEPRRSSNRHIQPAPAATPASPVAPIAAAPPTTGK